MNEIIREGNNLVILINNLLNNQNHQLDNPDYKMMYKIAKFHSLQNILFYALNEYLKNNDIIEEIDSAFLKQLSKDNKMAIAKSATQEAEKEILQNALEEKNINYMLLKGSVIKYLYPSYDMRSMVDLDVYYDKSKHQEVKTLMKNLGYYTSSYLKGNHDSYMKDPFMNVEMHRYLMNECYEMSKYYHNAFLKLSKKNDKTCEYVFKNEDYYIFMIAHAAKHFSNGGTGIRTVIDEYLYLEKYNEKLDYKYINEELDKLGLVKFEANLRKLAFYWFGNYIIGKEDSEVLQRMSEYILSSGTYGTISNSIMKDFMSEETYKNLNSNKFAYIIRKAFPPYKVMKQRNPILKKWKILLPCLYFTRILKAVFVRRKSVSNLVNNTKNITKEDIEKNKKVHDDMGV